MGTKYGSGVTITGYNSAPPSDDSSQSESNKVKWSTIKTKLPDPLKTAIEAVNSSLVTAFDQSVRSVTAADSTVAGDHNRTIQIASTVTASITISLGDAATMAAGYIVTVANQSTVACVVDRVTASNTINGTTASVPIAPLESITFIVNSATNGYIAKSSAGPTVDTNPVVVGSADATKKLRFEVDGFTTATTRVLTPPNFDGTIATLAGTETLTNKDISSATNTYRAASDTATGAIEVAIQSEMETGTSTTLAVTPGRQPYHPGHPKSWVNFNGTGTLAIRSSHGISSVTDNGTGLYTANQTTAFSANSAFAVTALVGAESVANRLVRGPESTPSTTAFQVQCIDLAGTATDTAWVMLSFFGDQ